jgi:AraC-like DNA-binding protein
VKRDRSSRGELNPRAAQGEYHAARYLPSDDLAPWVLYYWFVRWDRSAREPFDQEVLTQPSQHIVFEMDEADRATSSRAVGLTQRRFKRRLEGRGRIAGVAFHPGAFHSWAGIPMSRLTDKMVPLSSIIDVDVRALEARILTRDDDGGSIEELERFLRARLPPIDPNAELVRRIVERIEGDPQVLRVEALTSAYGLGLRALQRLFQCYVGIGPKWVIRRFRLIEAARRLELGKAPALAELSASLGYFDQAHFIRDFRATVGSTPGQYARAAAAVLASPFPSGLRGLGATIEPTPWDTSRHSSTPEARRSAPTPRR